MPLRPNDTQIPAQRVSISETAAAPVYVSREWYRFFDTVHTYLPQPGDFTATFTPVTNVTAVTANSGFAVQMGSVITLTGTLTLDPVAAGNTVFTLAPPILDNLSLAAAAGTFVSTASGVTAAGSIIANGAVLEFRLNAPSGATATYAYTVNYQIA